VPVGGIQLPLTSLLIKSARLPARHRNTHDLFVEAFGPNIEITGTEHLRHPRGLRLVCGTGAYPPSATVCGPKQIMVGTDYGFPWVKDPVGHVLSTSSLSSSDKIAILGKNAAQALKLG